MNREVKKYTNWHLRIPCQRWAIKLNARKIFIEPGKNIHDFLVYIEESFNFSKEDVPHIVVQRESGGLRGTEHWQCTLITKEPIEEKELRIKLNLYFKNGLHYLAPCIDVESSYKYCAKESTRLEGPYIVKYTGGFPTEEWEITDKSKNIVLYYH